MPSSHLILCRPLLLPPSVFPSIRVYSNESALCIRWPKYWSFSFSTSPSNEYSGLISFRIDWFDLLAVQGTLKSLLQHRNLKALVLQCSVFFMVQLSYPYMTTGKTITFTVQTFVDKVRSLLFNALSRFRNVPVACFLSPHEAVGRGSWKAGSWDSGSGSAKIHCMSSGKSLTSFSPIFHFLENQGLDSLLGFNSHPPPPTPSQAPASFVQGVILSCRSPGV